MAAVLLVVGSGAGRGLRAFTRPAHAADHAQRRQHAAPAAAAAPQVGRSGAAADPRDALADKPMPSVDDDASHPGPVSTDRPRHADRRCPAATATGPAQVPTGFPHTPAGAMAQLAAIDQVALQSGSLAGARAVIAGWAMPGGPDRAAAGRCVQAMAELFDAAGLSGGGSSQLALVLTPLMGQVKGSVGPDFVVPCVDFESTSPCSRPPAAPIADCQRMVWQPGRDRAASGRWMIGPGSEPATPPSVWPDTDTAIAVGYRDLRTGARTR